MDRSTYTANMTFLAMRIVGAVHDADPHAIRAAIISARTSNTPPRGIDPDTALITVLAALCDPHKTRTELLAWAATAHTQIADLYPARPVTYPINRLAVDMALSGALPAAALNPAELHHVTTELRTRGLTRQDTAHYLHTEPHHLPQPTTARRTAA